MRAGCLRHQVVIKSKTLVSDGMGGNTESWATILDTIRASILPVSATERVQNQQIEHEITHKIRIRYLPGVLPAMRVYFGSRVFEIVSIVNIGERNIRLDLICTELT